MAKFYFTFGTAKRYPYIGGWSEVTAPNRWCAWSVFTALHPTKKDSPIPDVNIGNYREMYTEEEWV